MIELKPEQQAAIQTEGDLLVSASAGSGKTFVMLERVLHAILNKGAKVTDFLLVTFTNAAAAQMRSSLQNKLRERFNDPQLSTQQRTHIQNQLALLPQSDISTLHVFCQKLIRKNFFVVDVDADFSIVDEQQALVLRQAALQEVLDEFLKQGKDAFMELVASYDNKRNFEALKGIVMQIFDFLQNQPDEQIFEKVVAESYSGKFEDSQILQVIDQYVVGSMEYFKEQFRELSKQAQEADFSKLTIACEEILSSLSGITETNGFIANHQHIFSMERFPNRPTVKDNPVHAELSARMGGVKEKLTAELKKLREKVYLSSDLEKLRQNMQWSESNARMLLELTRHFAQSYTRLKKARKVLDFSDLEHLALKILQHEELRSEVQARYRQIFVDEYQDINDIQEALIKYLWGENTLFLVGDPKQSIYRFRNTNPKIMTDKLADFGSGQAGRQAINLKYNFRSDKNILEFVNFIFSRLMTRHLTDIDYVGSSMFQAGFEFPAQQSGLPVVEVDIIALPDREKEKPKAQGVYSVRDAEMQEVENLMYAQSEANVIASHLADLFSRQKLIFDPKYPHNKGMRQLEMRDITLLSRSRSAYLNEIIFQLTKLGFPVRSISQDSIFEEYEVQLLHCYLKLLANTQDDFALAGFLSGELVGMSFDEMLALPREKHQPFWQACQNAAPTSERLTYGFDLIERGRRALNSGSLFEVLNQLIVHTHLESKIRALPNGAARLSNIRAFVDSFLAHSYNFDLLAYLSYSAEPKQVRIPAQSTGDDQSIGVYTMHESKGLEYPVVFLVDMGRQFNRQSLTGPCLFSSRLGLGVKVFDKEKRFSSSTLSRSAIVLDEAAQEFAEQLRVFYVAMTRAKNHLFIIGKAKLEKQECSLSPFALQKKDNYMDLLLTCLDPAVLDALRLGKEEVSIRTGEQSSFTLKVFPKIPEIAQNSDIVAKNEGIALKNIDLSDEDMQELVKNCRLDYSFQESITLGVKTSVSRLMSEEEIATGFNDAPERFRVSESGASASDIGNAYHRAMEVVDWNLGSVEEVRNFLRENLTFNEFNLIDCDKIFKSIKVLEKYIHGADKVLREQSFYMSVPYREVVESSSVEDRILIQGVIDLIICRGDETILVDFKTTRQPDDEKLRQKYRVQTQCYQKAVENALNRKVTLKILYSFFKDYEIFV